MLLQGFGYGAVVEPIKTRIPMKEERFDLKILVGNWERELESDDYHLPERRHLPVKPHIHERNEQTSKSRNL
jgi:hypothetical protein